MAAKRNVDKAVDNDEIAWSAMRKLARARRMVAPARKANRRRKDVWDYLHDTPAQAQATLDAERRAGRTPMVTSLVDGDGASLVVVKGVWRVNNLGYFVVRGK